jgi:hypothetical protein
MELVMPLCNTTRLLSLRGLSEFEHSIKNSVISLA